MAWENNTENDKQECVEFKTRGQTFGKGKTIRTVVLGGIAELTGMTIISDINSRWRETFCQASVLSLSVNWEH